MRSLRLLLSWLVLVLPVSLAVTIAPNAAAAGFTITTTTLPTGWMGTPYNFALQTSGGTGAVTWTSTDPLLAGLQLTPGGVVKGTPTASSTTGTSVFNVTATDSAKPAHTATALITYTINLSLGGFQINTTSLPAGTQWNAYNATVTSSGGIGKVTYSVTNGTALPQGLTLTPGGAISGSPFNSTLGGTDWVWVGATDSSAPNPRTVTAYLGVVVNANPVSISPLTLNATMGSAFSATFTAAGGKGPYTWSLPDNNQFQGLTLNTATGKLSGTPLWSNTPGNPTYFRLMATDSSNPKNTPIASISLMVSPSPIQVTTLTLPAATVGKAYTATLNANGGKSPYKWATIPGNLPPPGLTLSATGTLSGTPTAPSSSGTPSTFGVQVTDNSNPANSTQAMISITVGVSPLQITTTSLPPATVGVPYNAQLAATGGATPYLWSFGQGSNYPLGLNISPSGAVTGIPVQGSGNGPTSFMVQVMDSSSAHTVATSSVSLQINSNPLVITTTSLPTGVVGTAYTAQLATSGGTGKVTWKTGTAPGAGTLVAPLTVGSTGAVTGTPAASTNGPGSFAVTATDQGNPAHSTTAIISYIINPSVSGFKITTTSLPNGTTGQQYSATFTSSGGTGNVTWSVPTLIGSNFPNGLGLSAGGVLSGIPQNSITYTFAVQAKDSAATPRTVVAWFNLTVNQPQRSTLQVGNATLPPAYVGTPYTAQLQASGGSLPYKWVFSNPGSVPAWLKLSTSGAISGTPTVADPAFTFGVQVTDGSSPTPNTGTATITLPVYAAVASCTPANATGNAKLKGSYAFQLSQVDLASGSNNWIVGSLAADGNGNITAAQFDSNGPYSSAANSGTLTGTYTVGSDNRGLMKLLVPAGQGATHPVSFCMALDSIAQNGAAGSGRMVEDDASGQVAAGAFYAQSSTTPTLASLKGSYVFGLQGARVGNGIEGRRTVAGYVTLDGAGKISAGGLDINSDDYDAQGNVTTQYQSQVAVTGTYTVASSGRGTFALSIPGAGTLNFAFYLTASNPAPVLETDAAMSLTGQTLSSVMVGKLYARTTGTFNKATLSGTSVLISRGLASSGNSTPGRKVMAGILNWNGTGNVSGSADENNAGAVTLAPTNTLSATYSVDASGRATLQTNGGSAPVFYLTGPNQGVGIESGASAGFYDLENQAVPQGGFKLASFSGGYSLGTVWFGALQDAALSGVLSASGAGTLNATVDQNQAGNVQVGQTQTLNSTAATTGRFVLSNGSNPTAALYLVTPNKGYAVNIDGSAWQPILEINHQ